MRIAAIAFDLDGTLIDSAGGIAHALNAALSRAGLPGFDLRTVRAWIGDGPDALIQRALAAGTPGLADDRALAARLRGDFDAATLAAPMAGSAVFADVARVVAALSRHLPLAVVTNKPTPLARAVLDAAGLGALFGSVRGADAPHQRKPSPLLIEQAAADLRVAPGALLMVGDAAVDIAAAHAAGSPAAWAGWGYGHLPAPAAEAVWQLAAPADLLARLAEHALAGNELQ